MTTIQLDVQDDLIRELGLGKVKRLLEDELAYQRFKLLEGRIQEAMHQAGDVDWDAEFEQARQQAFDEYQQKRRSAS